MSNKEEMKQKEKCKCNESECECKECGCEKCECEDCKCEEGKCSEDCCKECDCPKDKCKDENCQCEDDCKCENECQCGSCSNSDVENLKTELVQMKGEKLALLAEFVNYKKRADMEKGDFIVYANNTILKQIIEIIDDFDRALKGIDSSEKGLIEGVQLIHKKLTNLISSYGLQVIEIKVGDELSPEIMEAVTAVSEKDEKKHNKVVEILQKGYVNRQTGKTFKNAVVVIGKKG